MFVILIIYCIGKLTYRSLLSKVVILCWLLIWILFSSCATSFEFMVVYVYGKLLLALRLLMSYIYGAPILDVSRSHTTTQHSR